MLSLIVTSIALRRSSLGVVTSLPAPPCKDDIISCVRTLGAALMGNTRFGQDSIYSYLFGSSSLSPEATGVGRW
jgi:hypothetical protein